MNDLNPKNQSKLYGLDIYFNELVRLYNNNRFPNKILFSGQKGIGKCTLAYHLVNYILTLNEKHKYNTRNFEIDIESSDFKTIQNKSNTNLITIDVDNEKKLIDINQIRDLINKLNKSSFNEKPRFVLIDNIELLNISSTNALLKILEEPNKNTYFILIHNNKKVLQTLLSRTLNFKIHLTNNEYIKITNLLLGDNLNNLINDDLMNYYFTPGEIYSLIQYSLKNNLDLTNSDLKKFLKILIKENHYKKNNFINNMLYNLIELYFRKLNNSFSNLINEKYTYFVKRIADTKTYNLDKESLLLEFNDEILDG